MKKERLIEKLKEYEITYDYEQAYSDIYNLCIDYMNETGDFSIEYLFEDYADYDLVKEVAKSEMEKGGIERIKYFINDVDFYNIDLYKFDGYGNLKNVTKDDIEILKEEIIDELERN